MAPTGKQAERRASKKAEKAKGEEVAETSESGSFVELAKSLAMSSVLAQYALKIPDYAKDGIAIVKGEKKPEKKAEEKAEEKPAEDGKTQDATAESEKENVEPKENVGAGDFVVEKDACSTFNSIASRLHWSNPLGLSASAEESLSAWKTLKNLEIDFGPRAKRNGTPGKDRIMTNLYGNAVQYVHVLLAFMMLRAFLFRSFFACLPWLALYQFLSVFLPLTEFPQLPQIPLEKVPAELRIVATIVFNGLLQLFFAYELIWKTYFFEKIPLIGLIVYHSYAVRPVEK